MMKKTLILLLSLLMVQGYCPGLMAQPIASEKQQNNTEAFREALKDAEAGDVFSMDQVAARYRAGNGTSIDYGKAMYWYRKVAEKGFPEAQYMLGTMYYFGDGTPVDKKVAFDWFYKAATSSKMLAPACYSLGMMYSNGEYVQADKKKAVEWYLKAAGNTRDYRHMAALAQNALGDSYYQGSGVKKDIEMAWAWFWFAQKYGNKDAEHNLAILDKELTPQQLRSARAKANEINREQRIMLDPPFPVLDIASGETKPVQKQNCPDLKGSYQSDINSTRLYLQKQDNENYRVVLDVHGYPLTLRNAHIVSKEEQQNQLYTRLPDCTLSIDNFGQLLPHVKGTSYRLRFDSQDWQKTFNTDFILKTDETPNGVMGMNKTSTDLPQKALDALKNK
ncbi:sel1 repeat family protein [Erwinia psidii]|uniref:tetratricopeptide repeat protein n=1 Tax=Erwinia psidii TaxID=69224 RepID=UPI00226B15DC|nr:tetratricopeptide repeat protein [Erwinia psidii]MCX8965992.1 sel1 repeat family protein [Erwinia psidii]